MDATLYDILGAWPDAADDPERAERVGNVRARFAAKAEAQPEMSPEDHAAMDRAAELRESDPAEAERILSYRFDPLAPPEPLPFATWKATDPPPREWIIPGMLPAGRLAALYGTGAAGKSMLALQVAAAIMHGGAPLKTPPWARQDDALANEHAALRAVPEDRRGRVLWLTWEDETDEVIRRWRMAHHARAVELEFPDPGHLHLVNMRALGGALWGPEEGRHVSTAATWTAAGRRFLATLPGHKLAVVDPLAAAFASSELDRALVRSFTSAIDGAAEAFGCAVLLVAHPSQSGGARGGGGYSGSTDWQASVRAHLILETSDETAHVFSDGECARTAQKAPAYRLSNRKQSYAADGSHLWLVRHYAKGCTDDGEPDSKRDQLAWFAARAGDAARAFETAAARRTGRTARTVESIEGSGTSGTGKDNGRAEAGAASREVPALSGKV